MGQYWQTKKGVVYSSHPQPYARHGHLKFVHVYTQAIWNMAEQVQQMTEQSMQLFWSHDDVSPMRWSLTDEFPGCSLSWFRSEISWTSTEELHSSDTLTRAGPDDWYCPVICNDDTAKLCDGDWPECVPLNEPWTCWTSVDWVDTLSSFSLMCSAKQLY